ncbi:hypothetical protein HN992_03530 [Candidatus Woesearchaeota archaeon]|jgi:hypothetical protein|nr:hypothetical protein [Candidatus Woesearchaeota archaeon]MBT3438638.1 hypothetical protein [Candidatus Woesearchaeota archaeon]MBT4058146.1 hypothetical protein [Candidatus Woesearchaeota archaeon]MBT4208504.1 hypothetical protein [Candidatus Woesearchaeota archaeon]MBT4731584.1 hypothetical protein [Candidatus Woesearchaeota archaeon]
MKKMGVVLLLIIMLVLTGCGEKEWNEWDYCSDNFSLEEMKVKALGYVSVNYPGAELAEFGYLECGDEETRIYGDIYLEGEFMGALDMSGISGEFEFISSEEFEFDPDNG